MICILLALLLALKVFHKQLVISSTQRSDDISEMIAAI